MESDHTNITKGELLDEFIATAMNFFRICRIVYRICYDYMDSLIRSTIGMELFLVGMITFLFVLLSILYNMDKSRKMTFDTKRNKKKESLKSMIKEIVNDEIQKEKTRSQIDRDR